MLKGKSLFNFCHPASVFEEVVSEGKKKRAPESSLLETLFKKEIFTEIVSVKMPSKAGLS